MNVPWYYASDGETHGPLSWAAFRDAARAGRFGPDNHVWTPGFGTEWKKASELGTLFPPPEPKTSEPQPEAAVPPPAAFRRLPIVERSPFQPAAPDGRSPARPRALQSLSNAWTNLLTILFEPFSLRRFLAFALCAVLAFLGAQSEIPTAVDNPEETGRLETTEPGLAKLAEMRTDLLRRADELRQDAESASEPAALRAAAAAALRAAGAETRDRCAELIAWTHAAPPFQLLAVLSVSALLLAALCALRAWFLSRAWTMFLLRVYRRDEPFVLSWAEAQMPANALFRGLFALRFGLLAIQAVATAHAVQFFGSLPAGPVPARTALAGFGILAAPPLGGALLASFVRHLVAPRILLLRLRFRPALRAAAHDCGFWLLRFLPILFALLVIQIEVVGAVFRLADAASFPSLLFPVIWALPAMPFELLRSLLSLDVLFRLHPDAREAVPPRLLLAVRTLRRPRGGAAK